MKIAIIGHGNVGGALAKSWAAAGHDIIIGARNPQDESVQTLTTLNNITATDLKIAAQQAAIIVVATPAHIAVELANQLGSLPGKIIIDASNAIVQKPVPYPTAFHAFQAITGAEIAKCFNTTGFENMENPIYDNTAADMFVAGSSEMAKSVAIQLAADAGFGTCYNFGGDDRVELLEQFALSWINLAIFQGYGRNMAFKIIKR